MADPNVLRVVTIGGRHYTDKVAVMQVLDLLGRADEDKYRMPHGLWVAHGGASGADTLVDDYCVVNWVPVLVYEADWSKHGRKAGPIRNIEMLQDFQPQLVVAFPGGRGTAHCARAARDRGISVLGIGSGFDHERDRCAVEAARDEASP